MLLALPPGGAFWGTSGSWRLFEFDGAASRFGRVLLLVLVVIASHTSINDRAAIHFRTFIRMQLFWLLRNIYLYNSTGLTINVIDSRTTSRILQHTLPCTESQPSVTPRNKLPQTRPLLESKRITSICKNPEERVVHDDDGAYFFFWGFVFLRLAAVGGALIPTSGLGGAAGVLLLLSRR